MRRILTEYLVALALFGVVALAVWVTPVAHPWFVPNAASWAAITFAIATVIFSLYLLARSILFGNNFVKIAEGVFTFVIIYLAGAFLLAVIGVGPPPSGWLRLDASVLTFFFIYNGFIIVTWLVFRHNSIFVANISRITSRIAGTFRRISLDSVSTLIMLAVIFFAPAVLMAQLDLAPRISTWLSASQASTTAPFFVIYTFAAIILYLLAIGLVRLFGFEGIPEKATAKYGRELAWLIHKSKILTFLAQVACFFTGIYGIYLLLNESISPITAFSIPIPAVVKADMRLTSDMITINNLQIMSFVASFLLALFIWFFSAAAISILLELKKVPIQLLALVVTFGLVSTYCGFLMWNGETATAEELRQSIRDTLVLVDAYQAVDGKTLAAARIEADTQRQKLDREADRQMRDALLAELAELVKARDSEANAFNNLAKLGVPFHDDAAHYRELLEREKKDGDVSGLPGSHAVAAALLKISQAFETAADGFSNIKQDHDNTEKVLKDASDNAHANLVSAEPLSKQLDSIQKYMTGMRTGLKDALLQESTLSQVLSNLASGLNAPFLVPPKPNPEVRRVQQTTLDRIREELNNRASALQSLTQSSDAPKLPDETHEDPEAKRERDELKALWNDLDILTSRRQKVRENIVAELNDAETDISEYLRKNEMISSRVAVANKVNGARDELRALSNVDVGSLKETVAKMRETEAGVNAAVIALPGVYPAVPEYKPMPLAQVVIWYYKSSLVQLLLQVTIDFGYTVALIIGVSYFP